MEPQRFGRMLALGLATLAVQAGAADRPPAGRLVAPVDLEASSRAGDTDPLALIDGSGLVADPAAPGRPTHSPDKYADGGSMWTASYDEGAGATLTIDLGASLRVLGLHVWNYNEKDWTFRGAKDFELLASTDGQAFRPVGRFALREATGTDAEAGEAIALPAPVEARYLRLQLLGNHGGRDVVGLSEIRARVEGAAEPALAFPKYPRPEHPRLVLGAPLPGAENIAFPADSGVIDVSKPPYHAKGDGRADDTAAIQRALDEHKGILYLPNGTYLVSDTLRWGLENGWPASFTTLQGQSRDGTVIVLKDRCPGFENPRRPKAVVWTGEGQSADRFANNVLNLTIDTGVGNPGACGVQYISNNMGTMADLTIVSGDGQGVAGLDMAFTNLIGPLLVKGLKVVGFDRGVKVGGGVNSQVIEHLTLEGQNVCGLFNGGQPLTVRGLKSRNAVTAVVHRAGFLVLVDAVLNGEGPAAAGRPAVLNRSALFARGVRSTGYGRALDDRVGKVGVAGPAIVEFATGPPTSLFPSPGRSLGLEVKETPEVPWGDPGTWTSPQRFVDDPKSLAQDATAAIQRAIDSGAETVYLSAGHYGIKDTIEVRGKVRRIVGCRANLDLAVMERPALRLVDAPGAPPVVVIERIDGGYTPTPVFDNASTRTLVLKSCINTPIASTGPGDLFIEDLCTNPQAGARFGRQRVWARQLNVENEGLHTVNDGGTLWVLGYKTERGGTLIETRDGGRTEVLGGFSYTTTAGKLAPMFVIDGSAASFAFAEVCFTGDPFAVLVREIRGGRSRELLPDQGRTSPLFVGAPE